MASSFNKAIVVMSDEQVKITGEEFPVYYSWIIVGHEAMKVGGTLSY